MKVPRILSSVTVLVALTLFWSVTASANTLESVGVEANCLDFTLTVTANATNQFLFYAIEIQAAEFPDKTIESNGQVFLKFESGNPQEETVPWDVFGGLAGLTLQTFSGTFVLENDQNTAIVEQFDFPGFNPGLGFSCGPAFIVIDEGSIDNGKPYTYEPDLLYFNGLDVNEPFAEIGLRNLLPAFSGSNVDKTYELLTGEVEDEAWFGLPTTLPNTWAGAGPTTDGLRNFLGIDFKAGPAWLAPDSVGPGLGREYEDFGPEDLLDKIPNVTPLRYPELKALRGRTVCAVVFDSDISINYDPLNGSLKGANLGVVAFQVLDFGGNTPESDDSLPNMQVMVLHADTCLNGADTTGNDQPRILTFGTLPQDPDPNEGGVPQAGFKKVGITKLCANIGPAIDNLCFVRTDPPGGTVMWEVSNILPENYLEPGDGGSNTEIGGAQALCIGPVPAYGEFEVDFTILIAADGPFNVIAVEGP